MNWVRIGSVNGLSPVRCQAITWTNADLFSIEPLGTNFIEIWIEIQIFSLKKLHLKMSSLIFPHNYRGGHVLRIFWKNKRLENEILSFPLVAPTIQSVRKPRQSPAITLVNKKAHHGSNGDTYKVKKHSLHYSCILLIAGFLYNMAIKDK